MDMLGTTRPYPKLLSISCPNSIVLDKHRVSTGSTGVFLSMFNGLYPGTYVPRVPRNLIWLQEHSLA